MDVKIITLAIILSGCGSIDTEPPYDEVYNQELLSYVSSFVDAAAARNIIVTLEQVDKLKVLDYRNVSSLGECYPDNSASYNERVHIVDKVISKKKHIKDFHWHEIYIRPFELWEKYDSESKHIYIREVMYHELNHCLRGQDHSTEPGAIMNPYMSYNKEYLDIYFEERLDNMFLGTELPPILNDGSK